MQHEESRLQQSCVKWFRYQFPRLALVLFAVPNGGSRRRVEGAIMKAEGVQAGVSDLLLLCPNQEYHGLCIEMKTPKGRQSPSQRTWQQAIESLGYKYTVCRSFNDFRNEVRTYLKTKT